MTLTKNRFNEQFVDEYIKAVERNTRCKRSLKKRYLEELRDSINNYLEQHPNITEEEFFDIFKSPEAVAQRFTNFKDYDDSIKCFKRRTKIITAFIAIIAVCVVAVLFYNLFIEFYNCNTKIVELPDIILR